MIQSLKTEIIVKKIEIFNSSILKQSDRISFASVFVCVCERERERERDLREREVEPTGSLERVRREIQNREMT
jgi:hypothetical protein